MTFSIQSIQEDFDRMIYWTRIKLIRNKKNTTIFACVSDQYLDDNYKDGLKQKKLDLWKTEISQKWQNLDNTLEDDFFDLPHHFDIYANTKDRESNCLNFLLSKAQS